MFDENPNSGKFVSLSRTRPAVEIDCSEWGGVEPVSVGQFVSKSDVRPAVVIEASDWRVPSPISLVISFQFAESQVTDFQTQSEAVLRRMNETEQSLEGGAGLELDWKRSAPLEHGKILLTMTPRNTEGAEERLKQLIEWAKQSVPEFVGARVAM